MTLHKSSRRSGLVCRHLLELFVCFLATCAAPGCVLTPALWDWAKDDDIGTVQPLGVAFGSAEKKRGEVKSLRIDLSGPRDPC